MTYVESDKEFVFCFLYNGDNEISWGISKWEISFHFVPSSSNNFHKMKIKINCLTPAVHVLWLLDQINKIFSFSEVCDYTL